MNFMRDIYYAFFTIEVDMYGQFQMSLFDHKTATTMEDTNFGSFFGFLAILVAMVVAILLVFMMLWEFDLRRM